MKAIEIPIVATGIGRFKQDMDNVGRIVAGLPNKAKIGMSVGRSGAGRGSIEADLPGKQAKRTQKNQPKSIGRQIFDAIKTSRVSIGRSGVQIEPLVNKLIPVFTKMNPAAVAVVTALGLLGRAANEAAGQIGRLRDAQITGGGTARDTGRLKSFGGAIGLSEEEMADEARQFQEKTASDGAAASYASNAGIHSIPGPYGKLNAAEDLIKWIEHLRKLPENEAKRAARATGTERFMKFRDISEGTWQGLKRDGEGWARSLTPENTRGAADHEANASRLKGNAERAGSSIGRWIMGFFDPVLGWLADSAGRAADTLEGYGAGMFDPKQAKAKPTPGVNSDPKLDAMRQNTEAIQGLSRALKEGAWLGGKQVSGAVPGAWTLGTAGVWGSMAPSLGAFKL